MTEPDSRQGKSAGGTPSSCREAELVAVGIGQHDMSLFRELPRVAIAGAELERRRDGVLLINGARGRSPIVDRAFGPEQCV